MLRLRLQHTPERIDLRLELARAQLAAADFDAALETLKPLTFEQTVEGEQARKLNVETKLAAWRSIPAQDPRKDTARIRLVSQLESERAALVSRSMVERRIEIALEMQRPDLAAVFELDLARIEDDPSIRCKGAQGRACHALRAIDRALESGSGAIAATIAADAVRLFPHHPNIVHRAVRKALEANRADDAMAWLEALLPYDSGRRTLNTLVSLELANERPDLALAHLQQRLAQDPSALDLRPKIAQMAEWVGRPEVALDMWTTIGRETGDTSALDKARHLAQQLADVPLVCELLLMKGQFTRLSTAEMHDVETSCDIAMLNDDLAGELEKYVALHPNQIPALKLLALILKRAGQVERSELVRQKIYALDRTDLNSLLALAALRWRMSRPAEALALLVERLTGIKKTDVDYWQALAALGWSQERDNEARAALDVLWEAGDLDETSADQLLVLADEQRDYERIIQVGNEAWERFRQPHWLMTAMEAAAVSGQWEPLRDLVATSRLKPEDFVTSARWWMLVVELADHDRDTAAAMTGLQQAIALEPDDKEVRENFLWRALELDDPSFMAAAVGAWDRDAEAVPAIWRPLASGFNRLGNSSEAARWLKKAASTQLDDLAWQVDVAEEMESLERHDLALPLWRHIETLLARDTHAPALLRDRTRLRVAQMLRGPTEIEQAALLLLANHPNNPEVRTDVIYAWLDIERPQRAREALDSSPTPLAESVQIHVALASQDLQRLSTLLDAGASFTPVDRVGALRALGRLTQARVVARASLPSSVEPDRTQLAEHAQELREALGTRASLSVGSERHPAVGLDTVGADVSTGFENGRLSVAAAVTRVQAPYAVYETNASVAVERNRERYFTRADVGVSVRRDSVLPQVDAQYRHRFQQWLELGAELRVNSLKELSPALRAVGSESRLGGVAQVALGDHTLLMAEAWARRLAHRNDGPLAHGFAGHVALERSLRFSAIDLSFNLTGSVEKNRFTSDPFNPNAPVEHRGEMFAAASAFLLGGGASAESPWSLPRPFVPQWRFAFWTGWLVPEGRNAFNALVEAALPVSDDITFVVDGFISNDEPWLHNGGTSAGARLTGKVEF